MIIYSLSITILTSLCWTLHCEYYITLIYYEYSKYNTNFSSLLGLRLHHIWTYDLAWHYLMGKILMGNIYWRISGIYMMFYLMQCFNQTHTTSPKGTPRNIPSNIIWLFYQFHSSHEISQKTAKQLFKNACWSFKIWTCLYVLPAKNCYKKWFQLLNLASLLTDWLHLITKQKKIRGKIIYLWRILMFL